MSARVRCSTAPSAGLVFLIASALGVLLFAGTVGAAVVRQHYEFADPVVKTVNGYDKIAMGGAWSYGAPGEPVLPMAGARVLLPPGEEIIGIEIIPGERVTLTGSYLVEPGQSQYPLSFVGPIEVWEPDEAIYSSASAFPGKLHDEPQTGLFRGYRIASFALHPVEYVPAEGRLSYLRSADVQITTAPSHSAMLETERMIRHDERTIARLSRLVDNPGDAGAYRLVGRVRTGSRSLNPDDAYGYIIITTDSWDGYLDPLVEFETNRGYKAGVFLKSWILSSYTTGVDDADDIRDFIIDAYDTWDIEYVLLVGDARDAAGIPHRGLYSTTTYGYDDDDIPADMYFGCLDGNWNTDGDSRWGEPGEDDLYHELGVGRACVDSQEEIESFVTKVVRYQDEPVVSESDEALMVGELLWTDPLTYGGDSKDQIKDGSSAHGYTTVGFPASMNVGTLYDKHGTWSKSQLISIMESGMNIVNHLGHCNVTYCMKMDIPDIAAFDNDGTVHSYNFVYTQGCYGGSFDNRGSSGSYGSDCFAEEFQTDDDGPASVIMNSRYGFGDPGGTNGSSQYYDREFFDAMFAEEIYPVADANDDSKMDCIWSLAYGANRWCMYELNVFGDPAMHLWTGEPGQLDVIYDPVVFIGQPDMDVTVNALGGGPVGGARVTIYTDDYSVYDTAVTNAAGLVTLHPSPETVGTLHVKATAHDYLVWDGEATIAPPEGPYVVYDSSIIDDDQLGGSSGNGDGIVNAGERIELVVRVENVGVELAEGVTATLSTENGHTMITDGYEVFGDIPPDGFASCEEDYDFIVSPSAEDGEAIAFELTVSALDEAYEWLSRFSLVVSAPVVAYADHIADDSPGGGNGNGCVEAGETIALSVSLTNSGSANATDVGVVLSSDDPYVMINQNTGGAAAIGSGNTLFLTPDYSFTVMPDCPEMHQVVFDLTITADWGYQATAQFAIVTSSGNFSDDMESGEGLWTHDNVTAGFVDDWHMETHRYHSTNHSWKFGGPGSGEYSDSADGALMMPTLCLGTDAELTFWHWISAEEENSTWAWDCGLLEITTDGGSTWEVIVPDGGYSHLKNYNPANPLPEGTPCWSGYQTWAMETFDLSAYEGETAQIRFRFASDGHVTEEGWYVDDVQLVSSTTSVPIGDETLPEEFSLRQNAPNPFNPVTVIFYQLPEKAHVKIEVYNVAGKHVKTIVDEELDAGFKTASWDGTNEAGNKVASGVYMYRMRAGDFMSKRSMVLLK